MLGRRSDVDRAIDSASMMIAMNLLRCGLISAALLLGACGHEQRRGNVPATRGLASETVTDLEALPALPLPCSVQWSEDPSARRDVVAKASMLDWSRTRTEALGTAA